MILTWVFNIGTGHCMSLSNCHIFNESDDIDHMLMYACIHSTVSAWVCVIVHHTLKDLLSLYVLDKAVLWVTLQFSRSHLILSGVCWPFVNWRRSHAGTFCKLAKSQCWHSRGLLFTGHCCEKAQHKLANPVCKRKGSSDYEEAEKCIMAVQNLV